MSARDKAIELARKLHALSKRGVGGEAVNADELLARFLKKTGLTLEDIGAAGRQEHCWRFKDAEHKLFIGQVIASVAGRVEQYRWNDKPKTLCVELTALEYAEVVVRLDHYWELWKEERELFYSAFIQANGLYIKPDPDKVAEDKELTTEEEERLRRMWEKVNAVRTETPHKRIANAHH